MGETQARRRVLLLVGTHLLAFTLMFGGRIVFMHHLRRDLAGVDATLVDSYSHHLANVEATAGDDAAAKAGLLRHVERLGTIRQHLLAIRPGDPYADAIDGAKCRTMAAIAALEQGKTLAESDTRNADAIAACQKSMTRSTWDRRRVLELGSLQLCVERGPP